MAYKDIGAEDGVASPEQQQEAQRAALKRELEGYERRGLDKRAAEVKKALKALGPEPKAEASEEASEVAVAAPEAAPEQAQVEPEQVEQAVVEEPAVEKAVVEKPAKAKVAKG